MSRQPPRAMPPLDAAALDRLAIGYVGRYATTEAKLGQYLRRKLREAGWEGDEPPQVDGVVERCARLGYVDDVAFAAARGAALTRRGLGERRVAQALQAAGIAEAVAAPVRETVREGAMAAAIAFARRRRLGPFARTPRDEDQLRRDIAALARAGHSFAIARRVVHAPAGWAFADDDGECD